MYISNIVTRKGRKFEIYVLLYTKINGQQSMYICYCIFQVTYFLCHSISKLEYHKFVFLSSLLFYCSGPKIKIKIKNSSSPINYLIPIYQSFALVFFCNAFLMYHLSRISANYLIAKILNYLDKDLKNLTIYVKHTRNFNSTLKLLLIYNVYLIRFLHVIFIVT